MLVKYSAKNNYPETYSQHVRRFNRSTQVFRLPLKRILICLFSSVRLSFNRERKTNEKVKVKTIIITIVNPTKNNHGQEDDDDEQKRLKY